MFPLVSGKHGGASQEDLAQGWSAQREGTPLGPSQSQNLPHTLLLPCPREGWKGVFATTLFVFSDFIKEGNNSESSENFPRWRSLSVRLGPSASLRRAAQAQCLPCG